MQQSQAHMQHGQSGTHACMQHVQVGMHAHLVAAGALLRRPRLLLAGCLEVLKVYLIQDLRLYR